MKIIFFHSKGNFARTSKRLNEILADFGVLVPKKFNFKDALAAALGFSNYREWSHNIEPDKRGSKSFDSRHDEDLPLEELAARRLSQAAALRSYCEKFGLELPAEEIIDEWRPTAERPMAETITQDDIKHHQQKGTPQQIQDMLTALEQGKRELDETHIAAIRPALKSSSGFLKQWMPLSVGTIAVRAVNSDDTKKNALGISLFELLVEIGFTASIFHLTQALNNRASNDPSKLRVRLLLLKVKEALDNGEKVFIDPSELKRFYSRAGWFLLQSEKKSDKHHAFQCLKKGAKLNCPRSALTLSYVYSPYIDDPIFLVPGAQKSRSKRVHFLQVAIDNGYNPVNDSFPEGV